MAEDVPNPQGNAGTSAPQRGKIAVEKWCYLPVDTFLEKRQKFQIYLENL